MIFHWVVVIAALAAVYYQSVPSILEPVLWPNPPPLMSFTGKIAPNTILSHAVHADGHYHGPESMAFDPELGTAYVSFGDGFIRSFSAEGKELGPVFFTGGLVNKNSGKNGLESEFSELRAWCQQESSEGRLAWNTMGEFTCGRPLGVRFRKEGEEKVLYLVDAYHGLFKLHLATQTAEHLVTPTSTAQGRATMDPTAQRSMFFFNDLDISADGKIVFTDTSYRYSRSNNRPEILDGAPRGRLFQYDPATAELSVVLCGLHFPNGVQFLAPRVSVDPESGADVSVQNDVIVNELTRFRVLKVNTDIALRNAARLTASCEEHGGLYQALAPNAHTSEENHRTYGVSYFVENMPGLVDNVRVDSRLSPDGRQYYLYGLGSKSVLPFSLLWTVLQSNWMREIFGRVIPMRLVEKLVPRYGLVVVSNDQGELVNALHDPSGNVCMLSQADRHPTTGDLWLGSHSEPLLILPAKYVPAQWE